MTKYEAREIYEYMSNTYGGPCKFVEIDANLFSCKDSSGVGEEYIFDRYLNTQAKSWLTLNFLFVYHIKKMDQAYDTICFVFKYPGCGYYEINVEKNVKNQTYVIDCYIQEDELSEFEDWFSFRKEGDLSPESIDFSIAISHAVIEILKTKMPVERFDLLYEYAILNKIRI
jgi:hypothetical protein